MGRGRSMLVATVIALFAVSEAEAWSGHRHTSRTANFLLDTDCDPESRAWISSRLEAFRDALSVLVPAATGVPLGGRPIRLKLFETRAEYVAHAALHAPGLAHNGGFYDGATRTVVAYRRTNPLQLQLHEVAHGVLGDVFSDPTFTRYARSGWPVWFEEGFAEYVSSYEVVGQEIHFGAVHLARLATLLDALEGGTLLPISRVLRARPEDFSGPSSDLLYASAWGLVHLLLSEPTLRSRVPDFVGRLRRGEHGLAAFQYLFGSSTHGLERRLRQHITRLSAGAPRNLDLIGPALDGWTVHEEGHWRHIPRGVAGVGGQGVSYLTRAVAPLRSFVLDLQVTRDPTAQLGIVLGHHGASRYPYHTLLDLSGRDLVIRHARSSSDTVPVARHPHGLPAEHVIPLRLTVHQGVLSVEVDGQQVLRAPAGHGTTSLVGLYLQGGAGRFEHLHLAPLTSMAAGSHLAPLPGVY